MSDGKEVKRFYFVPTGEKDVFGSPTFVCHDKSLNGDDWFMPVEDHDRIVAELKAELNQLKRMYDGLMVSARITRESNAKTITRQARVIEELMEQRSELIMDEIADKYELEAIEQEQGEGT